jgi:hypothetical protein
MVNAHEGHEKLTNKHQKRIYTVYVERARESGPARALPVPTSTPRKTERRGAESDAVSGEAEAEAAISRKDEAGERWCGWGRSGVVSDHPLLLPDISPFSLFIHFLTFCLLLIWINSINLNLI